MRAGHDRRGEGGSLIGLGRAYQGLGQYDHAIAFHEQALAIAREDGPLGGEASSPRSILGRRTTTCASMIKRWPSRTGPRDRRELGTRIGVRPDPQ